MSINISNISNITNITANFTDTNNFKIGGYFIYILLIPCICCCFVRLKDKCKEIHNRNREIDEYEYDDEFFNKKYNFQKINNLVVEICPICFEELSENVVKLTSCKHYYHDYCIVPWLKEATTCPVCRIKNIK